VKTAGFPKKSRGELETNPNPSTRSAVGSPAGSRRRRGIRKKGEEPEPVSAKRNCLGLGF
jgi:hypothetical protein